MSASSVAIAVPFTQLNKRQEGLTMCEFFSAISNGKGKVLFFKVPDIAKIESKRNPLSYNYNSHTSIAHYYGLTPEQEDKWNKWEFDPEENKLYIDQRNTTNDKAAVMNALNAYFNKYNLIFLRKVHLLNYGDGNTGCRNKGDENTGNYNSGKGNTGSINSGMKNTGTNNNGSFNTGDNNYGTGNTGDYNLGSRNTGSYNLGDGNFGCFNTTTPPFRMFNKPVLIPRRYINFPDYLFFDTVYWVSAEDMTTLEKMRNPSYRRTGGFLKVENYQDAFIKSFMKTSKEDAAKTLKLPNFDYDIFEQITGITKAMIAKKLRGFNGTKTQSNP